MFIETYYDETAAVPATTSEPTIPYPELSGEELTVWRKYLPIRRQVENLRSWLNTDTIPGPVITEIERAKKAPRLFDRIEIWSRTADPMAVGIIGGDKPRYFSIVRWGDAELTLEQVKKRLLIEQGMLWLTSVGVVGWKGNLQFGVEVNERSGGWMTDDASFWKRWNSPATVHMLTEKTTYEKLRSESSFKFRVVTQGLYDVLLSNKIT